MKLLDANVLLYAYNSDSPHHEACRVWLEEAFNTTEPIAPFFLCKLTLSPIIVQ